MKVIRQPSPSAPAVTEQDDVVLIPTTLEHCAELKRIDSVTSFSIQENSHVTLDVIIFSNTDGSNYTGTNYNLYKCPSIDE